MLGLVRPREGISAYPQKPVAVTGGRGFRLGPRLCENSDALLKLDFGALPGAPTIGVVFVREVPPERAEGLGKPSSPTKGPGRRCWAVNSGDTREKSIMRTSAVAGAFIASLLVATALKP